MRPDWTVKHLTCEMCGTVYQADYDPKVVTERNRVAVKFYCCSLACERKSWSLIGKKDNR